MSESTQFRLAGGPVVIVGGGIIGMSIACHLTELGHTDVTVAERALIGEGATSYAGGIIRQQFSSPVNVELSRRGIAYYGTFAERTGQPINFRQDGSLLMMTEPDRFAEQVAAVEVQRRHGVHSEVLPPEAVTGIVAGVRTDDLAGATYCPSDGSGTPTDAVRGFAAVVRRAGGQILQHTEVTALDRSAGGAVTGVRAGDVRLPAEAVVLAPGPQAAGVGRMAGVDLPVSPHRRQAFQIAGMPWLRNEHPFTVDLGTGSYVHPNAAGAVIGGTDREVPSGTDMTVDWSMTDGLIAALVHRIPAMADARITRGWAGLREMTPDDHAIVGPLGAGLWVATGFSGHGFAHAPGIGAAVARWMVEGDPALDLEPLRPDRFAAGALRAEVFKF